MFLSQLLTGTRMESWSRLPLQTPALIESSFLMAVSSSCEQSTARRSRIQESTDVWPATAREQPSATMQRSKFLVSFIFHFKVVCLFCNPYLTVTLSRIAKSPAFREKGQQPSIVRIIIFNPFRAAFKLHSSLPPTENCFVAKLDLLKLVCALDHFRLAK